MKKTVIFFSILAAAACSPVTYDIAVDVKKPSEFKLDLKGCPPSVVTICERDVTDSTLTSEMALGVAEKLEKDLAIQEGSIPVYTMFADEINTADSDDMAYILTTAGSDRVIILDSLTVGKFKVAHPAEKRLSGYQFMSQTVVSLPFSLKFKIAALDSLLHGTTSFEASSTVADTMKWTLLSENYIVESKATSRALSAAPKVFHDMGGELGSMFSPQWEEQSRMLISFEGTDWDRAYLYAKDFKWAEAMKIWFQYSGGSNIRKAAYAAYNIAVACELQEQYDLALEWLDMARSKYPFYEISLEKTNVENALKEKKR